jgi:hypothetical protein
MKLYIADMENSRTLKMIKKNLDQGNKVDIMVGSSVLC